MLPRTQTFLSLSQWKCARKGSREGDNGRLPSAVGTLPMVPCGSLPVARLYLAKNEAPKDEADLNVNATL